MLRLPRPPPDDGCHLAEIRGAAERAAAAVPATAAALRQSRVPVEPGAHGQSWVRQSRVPASQAAPVGLTSGSLGAERAR